MGIDQAVSHIINCIRQCNNEIPFHFVVCGSGTHYHLLEEYVNSEQPSNLTLLSWLDKQSHDMLLSASDAGGSSEPVDNQCGEIITAGNIASLPSAIERCNLCNSDYCIKKATSNFNKASCFKKYLELYNKVLS